jgi:hypothetical protein
VFSRFYRTCCAGIAPIVIILYIYNWSTAETTAGSISACCTTPLIYCIEIVLTILKNLYGQKIITNYHNFFVLALQIFFRIVETIQYPKKTKSKIFHSRLVSRLNFKNIIFDCVIFGSFYKRKSHLHQLFHFPDMTSLDEFLEQKTRKTNSSKDIISRNFDSETVLL